MLLRLQESDFFCERFDLLFEFPSLVGFLSAMSLCKMQLKTID